MYLENLFYGLALEALYCDSRRSWLLRFGFEPELWLMSRRRWFRALGLALDEFAGESGSDAEFVIDWDYEPETPAPPPPALARPR